MLPQSFEVNVSHLPTHRISSTEEVSNADREDKGQGSKDSSGAEFEEEKKVKDN